MAQTKKNFSYLNKPTSYSKVAIILHWLIGISIIFMFILGNEIEAVFLRQWLI